MNFTKLDSFIEALENEKNFPQANNRNLTALIIVALKEIKELISPAPQIQEPTETTTTTTSNYLDIPPVFMPEKSKPIVKNKKRKSLK